MDLDSLIGQRVTLHGTAFDAHSGAVLMLDDGMTVYVAELPAWDEELVGRAMTLTGLLGREQLGPEPTVAESGAHSHGRTGRPFVLRDASWEPS